VEALSESLRIDSKPFGIRVSMVEPGTIRTPFYAAAASWMPEYALGVMRALRGLQRLSKKKPRTPDGISHIANRPKDSPPLRNKVSFRRSFFPFLRRVVSSPRLSSHRTARVKLDRD